MAPRPVYTVHLKPEPWVNDPERALRNALKELLRRHGLRAITIGQDNAEHEREGRFSSVA